MNRRDFLNTIKTTSALGFTAFATAGFSQQLIPRDILIPFQTDLLQKDVYLDETYLQSFKSVRNKLRYVQRYVGYGNFNIITFDDAALILRRSRTQKRFTKEELNFIEYIFYYTPTVHGFYGERITTDLTAKINKKEVKKIPYTGHYLYRGKPMDTYFSMKKDIGNTLILTSGVRSVVKQMKLFLDKLYSVKGNLSEASKSIAPPAFTYHSIGDFDVGKKGFGASNFTARFAATPEFNEIRKLTYIKMRYTMNNKDGVRYEPWHVKII
jgi:hypothetical protein